MSLSVLESLNRHFLKPETKAPPFYPLPEFPKTLSLDGIPVAEYISPEKLDRNLRFLSQKVRLKDYAAVVVNLSGGWPLYLRLVRLQNFIPTTHTVEYHRSKNGYSADVVVPIPGFLAGEKILIVEDVYDTGGTLKAMFEHAPHADAVVVVRKIGIPNQIPVPRVKAAVITQNAWLGGMGMNFGAGFPRNFPRNYPGIVTKVSL